MARPRGRPNSLGPTTWTGVRLPAELRARLERQAAAAGKTLSELIRELLEVEPEERASA